ncbi:MAG: hypothetical protein ACI81A_002737 [Paraglaciecola sp.]|jgi:hypothetical protein
MDFTLTPGAVAQGVARGLDTGDLDTLSNSRSLAEAAKNKGGRSHLFTAFILGKNRL